MEKIAVFGAGAMGRGIAQVLVQAGIFVELFDEETSPAFRDFAEEQIWRGLFFARGGDKKPLYASNRDVDAAFEKITWRGALTEENLRCLTTCDVAIEAIFEDIEKKKMLYAQIESYALGKPFHIFTNTSTIQIRLLAEGLKHPECFMGLHFFNPVQENKLIEAIPHKTTGGETLQAAADLASKLRKEMCFVPDIPGFVVNRILLSMFRPLWEMLENETSISEIDKALTVGTWPDHPASRKMVEAMIESAENLIHEDQRYSSACVTPNDVDTLMMLGAKMPQGPFKLKKVLGDGQTKNLEFIKMGPGRLADFVGLDVVLDCYRMLKFQEPHRWHVPAFLENMVFRGKKGLKSKEGFYSYKNDVTTEILDEGVYLKITVNERYFSRSVVRDLAKVFSELLANNNRNLPRAVILEIKRCRGADVSEFPAAFRNKHFVESITTEWHTFIQSIHECPVPVIALISGSAWGGGYEIALASDYIIAEERATIGLPEVRLGILPDGGGTQNLPRRVGLRKALGMTLGAETIKASLPFVDEVVPKITINYAKEKFESGIIAKKNRLPLAHVDVSAEEYAVVEKQRMAWKNKSGHEPFSFSSALRAIVEGSRLTIPQGLAYERKGAIDALRSKDGEEGIRALLEQREPNFTGN